MKGEETRDRLVDGDLLMECLVHSLICYGSSVIDVGLAGIKQGGHSDQWADVQTIQVQAPSKLKTRMPHRERITCKRSSEYMYSYSKCEIRATPSAFCAGCVSAVDCSAKINGFPTVLG